jgi:hypothetical protein
MGLRACFDEAEPSAEPKELLELAEQIVLVVDPVHPRSAGRVLAQEGGLRARREYSSGSRGASGGVRYRPSRSLCMKGHRGNVV